MTFEQKYSLIKETVASDLDFLENEIQKLFVGANPLDKDLSAFLTAPAKRLRPLLGLLFLKALFGKINPKQYDVLLAVELIHNATLIHDDVIDKAEKRRKQETLNVKFDNNLAVVAGDYLLSVAMEKVINTNSVDVIKICTAALKSTCLGEINQYFTKFQITSLEQYIEKSRGKTALLFEISILGGLILNDTEPLVEALFPSPLAGEGGTSARGTSGRNSGEGYIPFENLKNIAKDFAQNFGIAFQIRDDLINVLNAENDISSGIYTAPVIFASQENENILKNETIIEEIKKTKGIEKTKILMDNYFDKAISVIEILEDNSYKKAILELVDLLKTSL
jgi:geranylgeranyl pyrophosphate synthase